MQRQSLLSDRLKEAASYVYKHFLSIPYKKEDCLIPSMFESHRLLTKNTAGETIEIPRPNHGIAHSLRVAAYIPLIINFLKKYVNSKGQFSHVVNIESINHLTLQDIHHLQIAALFSVVGRLDEVGFSTKNKKGEIDESVIKRYRYYRETSANAFAKYAENELKLTSDSIQLWSSIVREMGNIPFYSNIKHNPDVFPTPNRTPHVADIILHLAHCMDLFRCLNLSHDPANPLNLFLQISNIDDPDFAKDYVNLLRFVNNVLRGMGNKISSYVDELGMIKSSSYTYEPIFYRLNVDPIKAMEVISEIPAPVIRFNSKYPTIFTQLFEEFFLYLNKLNIDIEKLTTHNDKSTFFNSFFEYFNPKIGDSVAHIINEQICHLTLSWHVIIQHLITETKVIKEEFLNPITTAIIVKDSEEWYLINFGFREQAEYSLRLVKLLLGDECAHELTRANVFSEKHDHGICYRFRMSCKQLDSFKKIFEKDFDKIIIQNSISEILNGLNSAIKKNNISYIKNTLLHSPALQYFCIDKTNLLHFAITLNSIELVELLIEKFNIDINAPCNDMAPIYRACDLASCSSKIVAYLVQKGAAINVKGPNGRTPLASAVYSNSIEKVKVLVATGNVNLNEIMDNGHTALINAVESSNVDLVKFILSIPGVDINHKRNNGESAFKIALIKNNLAIIKLFQAIPGVAISFEELEEIRAIIRKNAPVLKPKRRFFIKTVRPRYFNIFTDELADTTIRYPKRIEPKKKYTVINETTILRRWEMKTRLYTPEEKRNYTKAQSTTYVPLDFIVKAYSFEEKKSLGVLIYEQNVLLSNHIYLHAGGTIVRPYEHYTLKRAEEYAKNLKGKMFSKNQFTDFENAVKAAGINNANEVIARLRWLCDGSCMIIIVSDNPQGRLLAKLLADTLFQKFKKANKSDDNQPNIIFYTPDNPELLFKQYTQEEYLLDCILGRNSYLDVSFRNKLFDENNFECLLVLDKDEIISALHVNQIKNIPLALYLLKTGHNHIFKFVLEKSEKSLEELLDKDLAQHKNDQELVFSILYYALKYNDQILANYIFNRIDLSIFQNNKLNTDQSPLLIAVENQYMDWINKLISYPCFDLESRSIDQHTKQLTALHIAVRNGDKQSVILLLKHGADINARTAHGGTPLMYAAYHGYKKIHKLLLEYGADISLADNKGLIAFNYSSFSESYHLFEQFAHYLVFKNDIEKLDEYAKVDEKIHYHVMSYAIKNDSINSDIFRHAVKKIADINGKFNGMALLHHLILHLLETQMNWFQDMKPLYGLFLLLKAGANPYDENHNNKTIFDFITQAKLNLPYDQKYKCDSIMDILFHHAMDTCDERMINQLRTLGYSKIDVDQPNKEGQTRLYQALAKKPIQIKEINFLLMAGANVDVIAKDGFSPLFLAALNICDLADYNVFTSIVDKCSSIDAQCNNKEFKGWTLLHFVLHDARVVVAHGLWVRGANLFIKNKNDVMPLDYFMDPLPGHHFKFKEIFCSVTNKLMRFLSECDDHNIKITSAFMMELIGDEASNFAHKIVDQCIELRQSLDPNQRAFGLKILAYINNNERKNQPHKSEGRTNLSTYFRIAARGSWKMRAEHHRGDVGTAIYRACEEYEATFNKPSNIQYNSIFAAPSKGAPQEDLQVKQISFNSSSCNAKK